MPIKSLNIELECADCRVFMKILNEGKEEPIVFACPECGNEVNLRLRLGLII